MFYCFNLNKNTKFGGGGGGGGWPIVKGTLIYMTLTCFTYINPSNYKLTAS